MRKYARLNSYSIIAVFFSFHSAQARPYLVPITIIQTSAAFPVKSECRTYTVGCGIKEEIVYVAIL